MNPGWDEAPSGRRATRAALVELAAELFAERGYVQTSIRDITRRGEVTSGAIYGHFRNKADLLAEAIRVRTEEELESQSADRARKPTTSRRSPGWPTSTRRGANCGR